MVMRRIITGLGLAGLALTALACGESGTGGLTAQLVIREDAPGLKRQALRTAAVPEYIDRLQIVAFAEGATLAETNLWLNPSDEQQLLRPEGGTWELTKVRAGTNRTIRARAFLGPSGNPALDRAMVFEGSRGGITVEIGKTSDVGVVELLPAGPRIPETDFEAPSPPRTLAAMPAPAGEALRVTFAEPGEDDAAGFFLAIGTSTAATNPPTIERGDSIELGDEIAPGLIVTNTWAIGGPQLVEVNGLTNGVQYGVVVYAYDTDRAGQPLNFSRPATAAGTPRDALEPGVPTNLTITAGASSATIQFVAPGEDGPTGTPATYEVRAAATMAQVVDDFDRLPAIMPPPTQMPGSTVSFVRTYGNLGFAGTDTFYVGVRAVDASSNAGDIATALHTVNATIAPTINALVPHIAIAGLEVQIDGTNFGTATGTVTLVATETSTLTYPLFVSQWSNTTVSVALPPEARSGIVSLVRPDGENASAYLTVLQRVDDLIDDHEYPFEMIGAGTTNARSIAALYREGNDFAPYESAIERLYDDTNEGMAFVPFNQPSRSTAVGGTFSQSYNLFMFASSNDPLSMSTTFVSNSTIAPNAQRQTAGVAAGDADGVSVVFLDGGVGGNAPAMIAFTRLGVLRTATVADAVTQPFNEFYAITSTTSSYENVKMARTSNGDILMAYRTVTGTVSELELRFNTAGQPDTFALVDAGVKPRVAGNFEVIAMPVILGGPEVFIIAYEEIGETGTDVRLLRFAEYGLRDGYAPFRPIVGDRRLDDLGLVVRNGQVWISVLASRVNGTAELSYMEMPATGLTTPDGTRGLWPGVVLDSAPGDSRARLGCKPYVQRACPIAWLGDETRVFFIRR